MKTVMMTSAIAALSMAASANATQTFSASGATPADIQATVDQFRAGLGANNGVGGSFSGGRREINWDGVPDSFSSPNALPGNFFNANSPRGLTMTTPGTGFRVSADSSSSPGRASFLRARLARTLEAISHKLETGHIIND